MGNCQAIDAAALVIQHPDGRIERMYWSVTASEIMKINPGHYVSLIIPLPPSDHRKYSREDNKNDDEETTRLITRVKLLRSTDTLVLGRAYRLITSQEVMKVLRAKRHAKMKRNQRELQQQNCDDAESSSSNSDSNTQVAREERQKQRTGSTHAAVTRTKSWRPSLNSISEVST